MPPSRGADRGARSRRTVISAAARQRAKDQYAKKRRDWEHGQQIPEHGGLYDMGTISPGWSSTFTSRIEGVGFASTLVPAKAPIATWKQNSRGACLFSTYKPFNQQYEAGMKQIRVHLLEQRKIEEDRERRDWDINVHGPLGGQARIDRQREQELIKARGDLADEINRYRREQRNWERVEARGLHLSRVEDRYRLSKAAANVKFCADRGDRRAIYDFAAAEAAVQASGKNRLLRQKLRVKCPERRRLAAEILELSTRLNAEHRQRLAQFVAPRRWAPSSGSADYAAFMAAWPDGGWYPKAFSDIVVEEGEAWQPTTKCERFVRVIATHGMDDAQRADLAKIVVRLFKDNRMKESEPEILIGLKAKESVFVVTYLRDGAGRVYFAGMCCGGRRVVHLEATYALLNHQTLQQVFHPNHRDHPGLGNRVVLSSVGYNASRPALSSFQGGSLAHDKLVQVRELVQRTKTNVLVQVLGDYEPGTTAIWRANSDLKSPKGSAYHTWVKKYGMWIGRAQCPNLLPWLEDQDAAFRDQFSYSRSRGGVPDRNSDSLVEVLRKIERGTYRVQDEPSKAIMECLCQYASVELMFDDDPQSTCACVNVWRYSSTCPRMLRDLLCSLGPDDLMCCPHAAATMEGFRLGCGCKSIIPTLAFTHGLGCDHVIRCEERCCSIVYAPASSYRQCERQLADQTAVSLPLLSNNRRSDQATQAKNLGFRASRIRCIGVCEGKIHLEHYPTQNQLTNFWARASPLPAEQPNRSRGRRSHRSHRS